MRFDIITVMPALLSGPLEHSIIGRARKAGLVEIHIHDLRQWAQGKHRQVDDYAFGGGAGMVMMVEPVHLAITQLTAERDYDAIIYTSPDGKMFDQPTANRMSLMNNILILCGHYKGLDQRAREHLFTHEISIGDYVLTGGELAAAVMCDAVTRLLPGALGDETSALTDSFQDGLLAPPVYTRPAEYNGWRVPDVLLSGNDAEIDKWRFAQSMERTQRLRPDLLDESDT